jgi:hypothetical protein
MKSNDTLRGVPTVSSDQLTLDRTVKHLRKLRWIGQELAAQRTLELLYDTRLRPALPGDRRKLDRFGAQDAP